MSEKQLKSACIAGASMAIAGAFLLASQFRNLALEFSFLQLSQFDTVKKPSADRLIMIQGNIQSDAMVAAIGIMVMVIGLLVTIVATRRPHVTKAAQSAEAGTTPPGVH